ncbi:MAG: tetratricopeptide repeat protein [Marinibacterium sp.]|nr:tetratricopeptide repeat protein [Marinibacterium sp.]
MAPDHDAALDALIARSQATTSQDQARALSDEMWALWTDAPDDQAQAMLDRGMSKRSGFDYLGALQDFDALVAYCPDYAEGYNQRAFVHFLRQDFAAAIPDLDRALALSPRHVGALSGKALTLMGLGRMAEARLALSQALALNPWLPERGLAGPGGPLAPQGQDL